MRKYRILAKAQIRRNTNEENLKWKICINYKELNIENELRENNINKPIYILIWRQAADDI